MIGVAIRPEQRAAVTEFFELFKTPWEFCTAGRRYEVIVSTIDDCPAQEAGLVLLYNAHTSSPGAEPTAVPHTSRENAALIYRGERVPIFGEYATFPASQFGVLTEEATGKPAAFVGKSSGRTVVQVGYDLFEEVRHFLTSGQPAASAGAPSLELHIALLRDLITGSGTPLVEIPAIPDGCNLIACLTHDLDHPLLRNHRCDHTMAGFLYRATVGSVAGLCRGRLPLQSACRNLAAACKLPFVFLGVARDFWNTFNRYRELEAGLGATYFVIPEKGNPGRRGNEFAPAARGAGYEPADIKLQLEAVAKSGSEIGLHGIDAWMDGAAGRAEREKLTRVAGGAGSGVRMHWLFFDEKSPALLDQAGFSYDSSFGFNETVGYRAGTAQAYKPFASSNLLELPLVVMDTALFYPCYLALSEADAGRMARRIMDEVARFGGALTINWHDRSIAPERLWDNFYSELLTELKGRGAWFPSAAQAVDWFRQRRSAVLDAVREANGAIKIKASARMDGKLPGLRIRVHKPRTVGPTGINLGTGPVEFTDIPFKENIETSVVA